MAAAPPRRKTVSFVPRRENRVVIAANDLRLYEWKNVNDSKAALQLLATNADYQNQMKCFALSTDPLTPDVVAVGTTSGKVFITNLSAPTDARSAADNFKREFGLRIPRACNTVGFNPVFHNQLFEGLERGRSDYCLIVWDLNSHSNTTSSASSALNVPTTSSSTSTTGTPQGKIQMDRKLSQTFGRSTSIPSEEDSSDVFRLRSTSVVTDPMRMFGSNESVVSASWIMGNPYMLGAGMPIKYIRLFDTRNDSASVATITTKAINGIQSDPLREHRFATFSDEGIIKIWDARKLSQGAVLSIQTNSKSIMEIAWSSQRAGLLASASLNDPFLSLWELHDQPKAVSEDNGDGSTVPVLLRSSQTRSISNTIQSFAWHQTLPNAILTINRVGMLENLKLKSAPRTCWSPRGILLVGNGNAFVALNATSLPKVSSLPEMDLEAEPDDSLKVELQADVSTLMCERAIAGYALNMELNIEIANQKGDRALSHLWQWMSLSQTLFKTGQTMVRGVDYAFKGVYELFCSEVKPVPSSVRKPQPRVISFPFVADAQLPFDVFTSEQRRLALLTCGWGQDDGREDQLAGLETQGEYERAALLSLFHLDLRRAIHSLNASQDERLKLLSLAIAGYSNDGNNSGFNGLWKETVLNLVTSLDNPYLSAMFGFLTTKNDFTLVLQNSGLPFSDRVAFACRFLDDAELPVFIQSMTERAIAEGNLEGLLLTGLSSRGVDLAEAYINRTGDLQSVAILFSQVVPKKFKDERAENWRELYRDLLDQWQLWHERANFDIACRKFNTDLKPVAQVFARCTFCNQTISPATIAITGKAGVTDPRRRPMAVGASTNTKSKSTVCPNPNCRKPLPRCAICLLNLGSPISAAWTTGDNVPATPAHEAGSSLGQWFTWCQTCRHGGHVEHMEDWFRERATCPVADCTCRCRELNKK